MNSVRRKNISLKYQRFTPSGGKNIEIRKLEFVTKIQFLSLVTANRLIDLTRFLQCKLLNGKV